MAGSVRLSPGASFPTMLAAHMKSRCIITIGNFDGVHLGHRAILALAAERARAAGASVKVLTFEPHPASVLRPGHEPPRLSSLDEKRALLKLAGADEVIVLEPTRELLALEPRQFIVKLITEHHPLAFVEGIDFRFGRSRAGDVQTLRALGGELDFETILVPDEEVAMSDHLLAPVSSSLVRWLLSHGRVVDAAIALGRPFSLGGIVVQGDQRGRTLGIPTANLDPAVIAGRAIPMDGVYAGLAETSQGVVKPAAISIGIKPTFAGKARTIEAHLLDYHGDLYGQPITIRFGRWLREQQSFSSLAALKGQLERDVAQVCELAKLEALFPPMRTSPLALPQVR